MAWKRKFPRKKPGRANGACKSSSSSLALILAGIVWFGLEIYGGHLANEPAAVHLNG
jgi:hypothetical protein